MSSKENSPKPAGCESFLLKYQFMEDLIRNNKELLFSYLQHKEFQGKLTGDHLQIGLSIATKYRELSIIEAILLHPVEVNDKNDADLTRATGIRNVVEYAIMQDDSELLRLLLKKAKSMLFFVGQYSLLMLLNYHQSPSCQEYVMSRSDTLDYVNVRDSNGMTPLLLAARRQPSMVHWLLRNGADVTATVRYQAHDLNIMNMLFSNQGNTSSDRKAIAMDIVKTGLDVSMENHDTLLSEYHRHNSDEQVGYNPKGNVCGRCHSYGVLRFANKQIIDECISDIGYTDTTIDLEATFLSPKRLRRDLFSKAFKSVVREPSFCGSGDLAYMRICAQCKGTAGNDQYQIERWREPQEWSGRGLHPHCLCFSMCPRCTEKVMKTAVTPLLHDHTRQELQHCRREILRGAYGFRRDDVQTMVDILTELGPMPSDVTRTEEQEFPEMLLFGQARFFFIYLYRMPTREGAELIKSVERDAVSMSHDHDTQRHRWYHDEQYYDKCMRASKYLGILYEEWSLCPTLKFCCKKMILQAMPVTKVNLLPLPDLLKEYLTGYHKVKID